MGDFSTQLSPETLRERIGTGRCPHLFDVRRAEAFAAAADIIPTAAWRDHRAADTWGAALPPDAEILVYCVHGHQVSRSAAALLRAQGYAAAYLEGGIEGYRAAGGPLVTKAGLPASPSRWITTDRPTAAALAGAWFVQRFLDRDAVLLFAAPDWLSETAAELDAEVLPGLDALLARFAGAGGALEELATVLREAPQSAGIDALCQGLLEVSADDHAVRGQGLVLFDALYAWCRTQRRDQ